MQHKKLVLTKALALGTKDRTFACQCLPLTFEPQLAQASRLCSPSLLITILKVQAYFFICINI